jgi:hypothetical protein
MGTHRTAADELAADLRHFNIPEHLVGQVLDLAAENAALLEVLERERADARAAAALANAITRARD